MEAVTTKPCRHRRRVTTALVLAAALLFGGAFAPTPKWLAQHQTPFIGSVLLPSVVYADLIGDVGVLLAQLEQQLQLVSHAISTVQNLVQTVNHLGNIYKTTKITLQKARHGGLEGILETAQNLVSVARGVNGNLLRLDRNAAMWRDKIKGLSGNDRPSYDDRLQAAIALREMDKQRIQNAQQMNDATNALVTDSVDAFKASGDAIQESQSIDGIVGQVQLLQRINAQHMRVALNQEEMTASLVQSNNEALLRMAAEREQQRQLVEGARVGLDDMVTSSPVELPYSVSTGWE